MLRTLPAASSQNAGVLMTLASLTGNGLAAAASDGSASPSGNNPRSAGRRLTTSSIKSITTAKSRPSSRSDPRQPTGAQVADRVEKEEEVKHRDRTHPAEAQERPRRAERSQEHDAPRTVTVNHPAREEAEDRPDDELAHRVAELNVGALPAEFADPQVVKERQPVGRKPDDQKHEGECRTDDPPAVKGFPSIRHVLFSCQSLLCCLLPVSASHRHLQTRLPLRNSSARYALARQASAVIVSV